MIRHLGTLVIKRAVSNNLVEEKIKRVDTIIWDEVSMLIASKTAFLEKFLAVSARILNVSSIECHKKKSQPFSLSGVPFRSRVILISG